MNKRAYTNAGNHARSLMITLLTTAISVVAVFFARSCVAQTESESNGSRAWGFVFLDGRYVAPPYEIDLRNETLSINGYEFCESDLNLSRYEREIADDKIRFAKTRHAQRRRQSYAWTALKRLHEEVGSVRIGDIVVLIRSRPPLILEQTGSGQLLIQMLTRPKKDRERDQGTPDGLESDPDRATWSALVSDFQATPGFLKRADTHIASLELVQQENASIVTRNLWTERIEYPLTVFSMVVVALAFGHLLSTKPYEESRATDAKPTQSAVQRSLLIFGLLSVVDLAWTLLASQSAWMRELSPIGDELIQNPTMLALFKFSSTAFAVGLLYWLRRSIAAQIASWWCCLIMALVTARWLMFQSMFL